MYYLICILFYVAFLFAAFMLLKYILKKPEKNDKKKFASVFWEKSTNARNRSYIRSRKKRVKSLPLYQRFVYWLWFCSIVILIFIQPVLFSVIRYYFIKSFYLPENCIYFETGPLSDLAFMFAGFLCGIPLMVAFSYLTNRGIVKEADALYELGSFQEYPRIISLILSIVLLVVGLPIGIMSFNNYRYCTDDQIGIKSSFSFTVKKYDYFEIQCVNRRKYTGNTFDYMIRLKNGKELHLADGVHHQTNESLNDLFRLKGIEIVDIK